MITWSYGGGTQSAAIAVLVLTGKLPRPDLVVIADTSREVSATWDYMNNHVAPSLSEIGLEIAIIPHSYSYWDIVRGNTGDVLLPAFTRKNGRVGKMPTFCSNEWKQRPVRRYLRELGVQKTDLWLGISTDEAERMKPADKKWIKHIYPLIEIVPMSRSACVRLVEDYGWPPPPKSRCWMCPNQSPDSWKELNKSYPDEFEKAVILENEIRVIDKDMYFHSAALPLETAVEESGRQIDMFDGCDSGYCFT